MKQLPKLLIVLAAICVVVALVSKIGGSGSIIPAGAMMWLKLGGISLLFSIALSLLSK